MIASSPPPPLSWWLTWSFSTGVSPRAAIARNVTVMPGA
jgi:hypothetical protein